MASFANFQQCCYAYVGLGVQKKSKIMCIAKEDLETPTFPRKLLTATNFDNVATLSGKL